jgi:GDP/UDP-N,N'-diacetylbacillosamine 2-epimerase (hydrolysing)
MSRKICVVTGTRADYGLLRWVMQGISEATDLELQVVATGMHLSPEFGYTYRCIEDDGFIIDQKIEILLSSDSPSGMTKSMGLGLIGFADAITELKPDLVLLLGDRFEIFAAAAAALLANIPIAHLHGGESTEGAADEAMRHSVTKMAYLHFVANEDYQRRVIQLGEDPARVFLVGGLGIDNVQKLQLLERNALERELDFDLGKKSLLVTFHPATLDGNSSDAQIDGLLGALDTLNDTQLVFTLPNADAGSRAMIDRIRQFVAGHANSRAYTSLGQLLYLSCLLHVDGVVGNSSSGIIEAPSFRKGTINIGDRQAGRIKAGSVIDCECDLKSIVEALRRLYSPVFQESLKTVVNPYGDGGASDKIVKTLQSFPLNSTIKKSFYDLAPSRTKTIK